MDKRDILQTLLVSAISNEIESLYLDAEISKSTYQSIFGAGYELTETVPTAVGEDYFNEQLDILEQNNYLFLSNEIQEDKDDSFDEKDIAFYLIDADNDLPEHYKNSKHIKTNNESLMWNCTHSCVEKIKNEN